MTFGEHFFYPGGVLMLNSVRESISRPGGGSDDLEIGGHDEDGAIPGGLNPGVQSVLQRRWCGMGRETIAGPRIPFGTRPGQFQGQLPNPWIASQHTRQAWNCVGIAVDGDADRAVFSDELRRLQNGVRLLAVRRKPWPNARLFEPPVTARTATTN